MHHAEKQLLAAKSALGWPPLALMDDHTEVQSSSPPCEVTPSCRAAGPSPKLNPAADFLCRQTLPTDTTTASGRVRTVPQGQ